MSTQLGTITISSPCMITPRLLPGIEIGGAYLSISYNRVTSTGRTEYEYFIDGIETPISGTDIRSGCCGGSLQDGLASLLSFLSAWVEAIQYEMRSDRTSENSDLFPDSLREWAIGNSDEISMASIELEEQPLLIVEG